MSENDNTDNRRTTRSEEVEDNSNNNNNLHWVGVAAGFAAAAVAGGLLWATRGSKDKNLNNNQSSSVGAKKTANGVQANKIEKQLSSSSSSSSQSSVASGVINFLSSISNMASSNSYSDKVATSLPPINPVISNLNGLLSDIYIRFVQIKNDDFHRHYSVFDNFFRNLDVKMKEVDPYYNKYSSMKQFAGSHYDNLRIKSADEFDMDIVIGLCLNLKVNMSNPAESDIVIQHQAPGFVQLKMGTQYQNLPMRDGDEWQINKTAYKWKDDSNYLLRSKFLDWFKSVVNRALDQFPTQNKLPVMNINGYNYTIRRSEAGPSMTVFIEKPGFKLDVDLVPALKFPEDRWPISKLYRNIPPECRKGFWMVVGKPNKNGMSHEQNRSWRIALHYQERDLIHNCYNLKTTLRLMKCLRDAQGMTKIASYYIKTLFLWEVVNVNDKSFWRNSPAYLFKYMVGKLHAALVKQEIPYFWNKHNNMIQHIDSRTLFSYAAILVPLLQILDNQSCDNYKNVAKYLLTKDQFQEYNRRYLHI